LIGNLFELEDLGPKELRGASGRAGFRGVAASVESRFEALHAGGMTAPELQFRQGVPPDVTYLFKHALVQDTAYSTLLREPHVLCTRSLPRFREGIPRHR
jgi:hypothetical protein